MKLDKCLFLFVFSSAVPASAALPMPAESVWLPNLLLMQTTSPETTPLPSGNARILAESLTLVGAGLALPMGTYLGVTQTGKSFQSFFTGFGVATALGSLVAPLSMTLVHHLMGGKVRWGHALLGAGMGLLVGALVGLPLATLPNDGYHAGLGVLWTMPATATLIALEWP